VENLRSRGHLKAGQERKMTMSMIIIKVRERVTPMNRIVLTTASGMATKTEEGEAFGKKIIVEGICIQIMRA
jgi:hypothetical protein